MVSTQDHRGGPVSDVKSSDSPGRGIKKGKIMCTICAFTVATLICAARYETSYAAPIAPLTGIQAGSGNITLVYTST